VNVEILYTAWNRLEFTKASFNLLARNTDWERVSRLVVYDDGSEDGTRRWLESRGRELPVAAFEVREGGWRSTGATMNDFVALTEAEAFVKIDNDIALPPGWLEALLWVAEGHPEYELIGMEAGWTGAYEYDPPPFRSITPTRHIGGVGLMRTRAFEVRRPIPLSLGKNGRAGFTIWQHRYHLKAGWVTPDLPVVQFDRIPEEPWASWARVYVERGWARSWDPYLPDMKPWWSWIPSNIRSRVRKAPSPVAA
jgi:glycosyltransferase involved in cell wall biosynthesis